MKAKDELRKYAIDVAALLKKKYDTRRIFLIGSVVTGRIHEHSDIDLIVEGLPPRQYIRALAEAYDLLPPTLELNLIPYEEAFESLKEKAEKDGELLYA